MCSKTGVPERQREGEGNTGGKRRKLTGKGTPPSGEGEEVWGGNRTKRGKEHLEIFGDCEKEEVATPKSENRRFNQGTLNRLGGGAALVSQGYSSPFEDLKEKGEKSPKKKSVGFLTDVNKQMLSQLAGRGRILASGLGEKKGEKSNPIYCLLQDKLGRVKVRTGHQPI